MAEVYIAITRPEGYEDVCDDLVTEDAHIDPAFPVRIVTKEIAALRATVEAARHLVAALDYTTPSWRAETLKAGKDGDEVNAAWDELIAALEGEP